MANTCGCGSLPVRFKVHDVKPCWVSSPRWNAMPSLLPEFLKGPFLLIAYKFTLSRVVFNFI